MRSCASSTGPVPCLPSTPHQMRWVPAQALKPIPVQLMCIPIWYPTNVYLVPTVLLHYSMGFIGCLSIYPHIDSINSYCIPTV